MLVHRFYISCGSTCRERKEGMNMSSNWLPIGIIGIILGLCLFVGGFYAYGYVEWLSTWHDTPFGQVRDWCTPYKVYTLPMYMLGICLFVVGIVSIWYDRRIGKEKKD